MNKIILPIVIIILIAITRLIPHPPNFTPIFAIILFGGAYIKDYRLAIAIPLASMLLSDLYISGFHSSLPFVYLGLALIIVMGLMLRNNINIINCAISFLSGPILFFLITNFGVWIIGYPKSIVGILECYTVAIPFFYNSLFGTVIYGIVLFGGYEVIKYFYQQYSFNKSV